VRRSLRLLVAATTSAVALSLLIPLVLLVRVLAEDRAVQAANEEARTLATVVTQLPEDTSAAAVVESLDQATPLRLSVQLPDGARVGGDDPAGSQLSSQDRSRLDDEFAQAADGRSFTSSWDASPVVYVPSAGPAGTFVVRAQVPEEETHRGVGRAIALLAVLGLAMVTAAVVLADYLARRISAPLSDIAATARRLRAGELEARAPETGAPEVMEVGTALNDLAERVDELLVAERETVADLTHRLRTPVTALRLASEQLDEPAGGRVRAYLGELERAVDGVVRDARRPVSSTMSARCDASAVAADRVAYWTPLAEDQGVTLKLTAGGPAPVRVDAAELSDVLDALLDNAFAHAEPLTSIDVTVAVDEGTTRVTVGDDGPGLRPGALVERGISGSGSTGLGLDIARRTALAGGGDLVTGTSSLGGALVGVELRSAPH
jgi:signal transduction histidine kinase